jgi:hypothetical protein
MTVGLGATRTVAAEREIMKRYDASTAPDPEVWLQLDEQERIDLAIAYHRRYHLPMGQSPKVHGAVHAIVRTRSRLAM